MALLGIEFLTWTLVMKCLNRHMKQLHLSVRNIIYLLLWLSYVTF
jgi:hypothetical protein